jgi:hypothetical protein
MAYVMAAADWLDRMIAWTSTGDRLNAIYFCLAAALLLELSYRVLRRFIGDVRLRAGSARAKQRVGSRFRKTPGA